MDNTEDLLDLYAKANGLQKAGEEPQAPQQEPEQPESEVNNISTEPVVDQTQEEVTQEPTQQTEEPVVTEPVKEPAVQMDFNSMWGEKYGDKYGDVDTFFNNYEQLKAKAEENRWGDQFDDTTKSKIESLLTTEGDINWNELKKIADANTMDVDSLDDLDVLKKKFALDGFTPREIELQLKQFKKLKSVDREDLDQDELDQLESIEINFLRSVREGREQLKRYKEEQANALKPIKREAPATQSQEQLEELKKQWQQTVNSSLSDFNKVTFNLDKEKTYDFDITPEIKNDVKSSLENIESFYKNYVTESGFDFNKARQDMFILKNWEKIISTLTAQNFNNGVEKSVKEISNVDFEGTNNAPKPKKSPLEQIAEQMNKLNY